jgi:hypothetical protein
MSMKNLVTLTVNMGNAAEVKETKSGKKMG